MRYRRMPWKKGFRKLPDFVKTKLESISTNEIRVETVKNISKIDLSSGILSHIGILYNGTKIEFHPNFLPDPSVGHASNYNRRTKVIVCRDIPKVPKTFSWESPNFGDWSKGSHDVDRTIDVYQKIYLEPLFLEIGIEILNESDIEIGFRFSINRILNKEMDSFETELLRDLNLLQENCGNSSVYSPNTESQEYSNDLQLEWEILPPGTREDIIRLFFKGSSPTKGEERQLSDRYEVINQLRPLAYINGKSGMQRYFGAMFSESLVAFENLKYGNAIYVFQQNWIELSRLTRIKLMQTHRGELIRIIHRDGWERRLSNTINALRPHS